MKVLFKENINGKCVVVKDLNNFNLFKEVIAVFKNPPYFEILTDEDCFKEYISYMFNGHLFGCFVDDSIAGINCILNGSPKEYSIGFENENRIAYYSGLAVKDNYRRLGLGKLLVEKTEEYLESTSDYDMAFARILCSGSMSEGIFKLNGFEDAYDNGLIIDDVTYERNDGTVRTDMRKYMVKRLKDENNYFRR